MFWFYVFWCSRDVWGTFQTSSELIEHLLPQNFLKDVIQDHRDLPLESIWIPEPSALEVLANLMGCLGLLGSQIAELPGDGTQVFRPGLGFLDVLVTIPEIRLNQITKEWAQLAPWSGTEINPGDLFCWLWLLQHKIARWKENNPQLDDLYVALEEEAGGL